MPNIVIETNRKIGLLSNRRDIFFDSKGRFMHPVSIDTEKFIIKAYQKQNGVVLKLEKATKPKITSNLKKYMIKFAETISRDLNGKIKYSNLNSKKDTDYSLYDKYEITTDMINSAPYINSLFKNKNISVEIGMGSGEFITDKAIKNPNVCFVGFEILNQDFHIALNRFKNNHLENVKSIFYDAKLSLERFRENSLNTVYLNFPEPWYKIKKIKHSVLTRKTAKIIESILAVNGTFIIMTDNYPYAVAASTIISNSTKLQNKNKYHIIINHDNIKTKYEKKWIKYQRTIYKLEYKKNRATKHNEQRKITYPVSINLKNKMKDNLIFKILDIYKNGYDEKIIEIVLGDSKNTQRVFFSLNNNNEINILPQSKFIENSDFIKSIRQK